jgi:hypothetical protein
MLSFLERFVLKRLTKSRITMGISYEQEVALKSYDATVKIHPVSDITLIKIQEQLGFSIDDVLGALSKQELTDTELVPNSTKSDAVLKKLTGVKLPPKLFQFMAELCRAGLVPEPDPECSTCHGIKGKDICPQCDIRLMVDQIRGFATIELGAAILGASLGDFKAVEDFFTRKKALSGAGSSAPGTS